MGSESRRPSNPVSDTRIEHEQRKALRCLDYFEGVIRSRPDQFQDWNFSSISFACALSLMDFHGFLPDWQTKWAGLGDWFSKQASRPSMIETAPK
jgi:hypothetical protein